MITHACFKALLFLGAGSVIHGLDGEQDMRRMGALRKLMPITAATFIVGWLAISGIPPFAGFWSKDEVLINAWDKSPLLWVVMSVAAVLTAYYMSRLVFLTFFGEARWDEGREGHEHVHPHETPALMTVPLVVLAVASTVIGVIDLPFDRAKFLDHFLDPVFGEIAREVSLSGAAQVGLIILATLLAVLGVVLAYQAWVLRKIEAERLEPQVLQHAWFINDGYAWFFGGPAREGAQFTSDVVDHEVIDGAVNGVGVLVRGGARQLRRLQSGYVRSYALGIAAGAVLLLAWFFSRVSV
jgi:NADH-quinone oxidoreductase subunit L